MNVRRVAPVVSVVVALSASLARADDAKGTSTEPVSTGDELSPYEKETIEDVVHDRHAEIDPAPEGKTVEAIDVAPLEVIEKRDPLPSFVNDFHTTTRPWVIDQEVLLRPGQPYKQALVDETTRNLRDDLQSSLVVVLPIRGSTPDKVRLLVIVKDVWSLRLNSDWRLVNGKLEYLFLQPSEWNVAGTHHSAGLQFIYQPLSYSLGATYTIPRFLGTWIDLHADANVIVNNNTKQTEGSFGSVRAIQPLYSALTEWAWGTELLWNNSIQRRYVNAELGVFRVTLPDGTTKVDIPYQYSANVVSGLAYLTRSFGWRTKNDFTFGVEASRRVYSTLDSSGIDPFAADAFRNFIPVSDKRVNPFVQWEGYSSDFMRVLDFETLGLQEDYRLWHDLLLKVYPVTTAFGSSHDFIGVSAGAYYTVPLSDGLARVGAEGIVESGKDGVSDALVDGHERFVTPKTPIGRLVFDGRQLVRPRDSLRRVSFLGGDGRLRGYPTSFAVGRDVMVYNLEFRTRPVEVFTVQLGAAFFWDTGDAFDDFSQMSLKHGAGAGLRVLFPQLDRYVLRADVGFPVALHGGRAPGTHPYEFVITFQQAFPVPSQTKGTVFSTR